MNSQISLVYRDVHREIFLLQFAPYAIFQTRDTEHSVAAFIIGGLQPERAAYHIILICLKCVHAAIHALAAALQHLRITFPDLHPGRWNPAFPVFHHHSDKSLFSARGISTRTRIRPCLITKPGHMLALQNLCCVRMRCEGPRVHFYPFRALQLLIEMNPHVHAVTRVHLS